MKHLFFLILLFTMMAFGYVRPLGAQTIPNGGFETWTNGVPDGWYALGNDLLHYLLQSSDAHSGSSAVHGIVVTNGTNTAGASIQAGADGNGIPTSGMRPEALHMFYKANLVGDDNLAVLVGMVTTGKTGNTGFGINSVTASTTTYKELVTNIYYGADNPDTAVITITIGPIGSEHLQSTIDLDDFTWGAAASGVTDEAGNVVPAGFELEQNFPNPFNPTTAIIYDVPRTAPVTLVVRDMLGRVVATPINAPLTAGRYKSYFDASQLESGMYVYTMTAGSYSKTRTMTLVK